MAKSFSTTSGSMLFFRISNSNSRSTAFFGSRRITCIDRQANRVFAGGLGDEFYIDLFRRQSAKKPAGKFQETPTMPFPSRVSSAMSSIWLIPLIRDPLTLAFSVIRVPAAPGSIVFFNQNVNPFVKSRLNRRWIKNFCPEMGKLHGLLIGDTIDRFGLPN